MGNFYNWCQEKFNYFSWTGSKKTPYGELLKPLALPSVDYSNIKEKSITTEITCYCSGHYITNNGRIFTIRERFLILVTYSNSTIIETMSRVRNLVMQKFSEENPSFMIDNVFVPELYPEMRRIPEPMYLYRGNRIWRYMTRLQEGRLVLETEQNIYRSNAEKIIKKYGIRRQEALIRRL